MANGYKPGDYFRQFLNQLPQMYYAKKNSELQRERFEYYKTKDAEAVQRKEETKLYNQNLQSWKQIQGFASSLPLGQQSNFIKKQIKPVFVNNSKKTNTLVQDDSMLAMITAYVLTGFFVSLFVILFKQNLFRKKL